MSAHTFLERVTTELKRQLYEDCNAKLATYFEKFELATKRKREEIFYIIVPLLSLYLLFGHFAETLCNAIGFAFPAYASFIAIETPDKTDDTQWLTYWVVFAVFSILDFFAKTIMNYFPFYWLAKCIFLLYLYLPGFRGAESLYNNFLQGMFTRLFGPIDQAHVEGKQTPAAPASTSMKNVTRPRKVK